MALHGSIVDGYLDGLDLKEQDRVIFLDLLPNRLPACIWVF